MNHCFVLTLMIVKKMHAFDILIKSHKDEIIRICNNILIKKNKKEQEKIEKIKWKGKK